MNKILRSLVVSFLLIVGTLVLLRSQTSSTPQWYRGSRSDFTNTSVYQTQSDFGGRHYEATIYGHDLDGVPKWKVGEGLPVDISKITANAESAFKKMFPQFGEFKIISVNLVYLPSVDDWVFDVNFNGTDFAQLGEGAFEDKKINVLVLLNGRVFMPTETSK